MGMNTSTEWRQGYRRLVLEEAERVLSFRMELENHEYWLKHGHVADGTEFPIDEPVYPRRGWQLITRN